MALPRFFVADLAVDQTTIEFDEAAAKHIVQVLRMSEGEGLMVTNGKGILLKAQIAKTGKKTASARVLTRENIPAPARKTCVAISLVKNASRFEWFLEKSAELGLGEVIPLLCERTERQHFRSDRLRTILQSAMLQSQQAWMTMLHEPMPFKECMKQQFSTKLIAHCEDGEKALDISQLQKNTDSIILIGPEGDFAPAEILAAKEAGFLDVSLGNTRLRTETAGMVAATFLQI